MIISMSFFQVISVTLTTIAVVVTIILNWEKLKNPLIITTYGCCLYLLLFLAFVFVWDFFDLPEPTDPKLGVVLITLSGISLIIIGIALGVRTLQLLGVKIGAFEPKDETDHAPFIFLPFLGFLAVMFVFLGIECLNDVSKMLKYF